MVELFFWSQIEVYYSKFYNFLWTCNVVRGNVSWLLPFYMSIFLPGLPGRPNEHLLRRGRRPSLPLFVFSARCLCALHHAVYNFQILDTNRQQVSTRATLSNHYTPRAPPSRNVLMRLLCLSARVSQRERVWRHRRGGSVQPRAQADILQLQKV